MFPNIGKAPIGQNDCRINPAESHDPPVIPASPARGPVELGDELGDYPVSTSFVGSVLGPAFGIKSLEASALMLFSQLFNSTQSP